MAIDVNVTSSTLETGRYFSTKDTEVGTFIPKLLAEESDFCACLRQCIPPLPAFTDEIGNDFYKNDFFRMYMNLISGGSVVTKIVDHKGNETTVTDNTYGERLTDSGFYTYKFEFYKIWNNLGYGTFKFTITNLNGSGDTVQQDESPWFKLQPYIDTLAHRTVRIETNQSGKLKHFGEFIGSSLFVTNVVYDQQIRLRGSLTFAGNDIENSGLQRNDSVRSRIQVKDQKIPKYKLKVQLAGSREMAVVLYNYLMANEVYVSDYNLLNHNIDPSNWNANSMRTIPLLTVGENINESSRQRRKSYVFDMEYNHKNVFKINS